ncbi:MAG: hypothetical protein HDR21_04830 [Lachnospiraceae bacterium]|nr:hypothetical protein [Lachnospiraceae bacterium]MBD5483726.1 hypothetical protein [Lachnospiraceae bacterium]
MLYHGTIIGGLSIIKANAKSHTSGKTVAYFTEDRCYALVCCRSRNENFVTMGLGKDGKQHYFERFPDQLKILYGGKRGYIYVIETTDGLINTKGYTWESETDIPVHQYEIVDNVYAEILKAEQTGDIVIHRYSEIDPMEQKQHANHIKEHIDDEGEEMKQFYLTHFSSLWD